MKRVRLAEILDHLGVAAKILRVRRSITTPWLTVLTYHRLSQKGHTTVDDGVATPSAAFERQLQMLTESFDLVGVEDLRRFVRGAQLPRSPLMITFDDGYRDNHDVALPLLTKYGARAVFFVATDYVERRRLFWWDRICHVLKTSQRTVLDLRYPRPMRLLLGPDPEVRARAIAEALRVVKEHFALDLDRYLEELGAAADVDISPELERRMVDEHLMTWEHVRALRRAGMDVQSHTHTHRVVETLPLPVLIAEMDRSRALLESVLGEPVRAVSYPVGRAVGYSAAVRQVVRGAGYELAFSNRAGVNLHFRFDPLDVKRISIEGRVSDAFARAILAIPALAY